MEQCRKDAQNDVIITDLEVLVPKARIRNLVKLGTPTYYAHKWDYIKAYWTTIDTNSAFDYNKY